MPPDSLTTPPAELAGVVLAIEQTEQALIQGQVEALPGLTENLTRALQEAHRQLTSSPAPRSAEMNQALRAIGQRLDQLQQRVLGQSATVQRALTSLFPAEQAQAYARLGQGPGTAPSAAPRAGSRTSFKA